MKKLSEYYTNRPVQMDLGLLCDPDLEFDHNREKVNDLVMNVVIKYLGKFLQIKRANIEVIRDKITKYLECAKEEDKKFNPIATGQYVENIFGISPGVDYYPLQCNVDIRSTAAIFKEIAFNDRFRRDDHFRGLDLGSGTGILTLAMAISASRASIRKPLCTGVEQREGTVYKSRRALKKVFGNYFEMLHDDLNRRGRLDSLVRSLPHFWVSETVVAHTMSSTPKLDLHRDNFGLSDSEIMKQSRVKNSDPFIFLLKRTMELHPEFIEMVKSGDIAMFPDIANGLYMPDKSNSRLILRTGTQEPLLMHDVGKEFEEYEGLGIKAERWCRVAERQRFIAKPEVKSDTKTSKRKSKSKNQLSLFDE